ncbi:hypothetical protein DRQ12_05710 [candidate division KSB1 bacterium]|nr:MAG: hypothetical protein DRQ12_05710 [candidate division KSB1 bacterium]
MSEYAAAYGRMRALKGKLLSREEFDTLLKAPVLNEAVAFVRTHTGVEISDTTSLSQIEHKLKESLLVDYLKIIKFLDGGPAEVVKCLISRFELINLKAIFHSKMAGVKLSEEFIFDLGPHCTINLENLLRAQNLEECFEICEITMYKTTAALLSRSFKDGKPYPLCLTLDLDYYQRLHNSLSRLSYFDKQNAEIFLGTQIDVLNILRFLRLKFNYSFSPGEIFHYILPYGLKFTKALFWKIAEAEDPISLFKLKPYNQILTALQGANVALDAEIALNRYLFNFAKRKIIGTSPFQITPLLAFFMLKEFEIRDIISILNGKKLGLEPAEIKKHLITWIN